MKARLFKCFKIPIELHYHKRLEAGTKKMIIVLLFHTRFHIIRMHEVSHEEIALKTSNFSMDFVSLFVHGISYVLRRSQIGYKAFECVNLLGFVRHMYSCVSMRLVCMFILISFENTGFQNENVLAITPAYFRQIWFKLINGRIQGGTINRFTRGT